MNLRETVNFKYLLNHKKTCHRRLGEGMETKGCRLVEDVNANGETWPAKKKVEKRRKSLLKSAKQLLKDKDVQGLIIEILRLIVSSLKR